METKFTKGNWKLSPIRPYEVVAGENDKIQISVWHNEKDEKEAEANAKLIAAAPELLEALMNLYKYNNDKDWAKEQNIKASEVTEGNCDYLDLLLYEAEQAIKKATK